MRVVLNTNIFISAVLGGKLGVIIDEWKAGKFKLIVTDSISHEYLDVINRPKFKTCAEPVEAFRKMKSSPPPTIFYKLPSSLRQMKKFLSLLPILQTINFSKRRWLGK